MTRTHLKEYFLLFLLLAINLALGIRTVGDYGESWDEARLYQYGEQSLNAYRSILYPAVRADFGDDDLRYYGPAYLTGMLVLVNAVQHLFPNLSTIDLWHMGNFLSLQLGLICLYLLLRRFMGVPPALTTTALFSTQPLIWGHSFINPKDIPFLAFFTASVYSGLKMLDHFERQNFAWKGLVRNAWFYAACVLLGLTISIRILGFAAAGIVLFHFVFINAKKVLRLSYAYVGLALFVSLLTWPSLWPSPVIYFLQSIYAMWKFQWVGYVLFNGTYYWSNDLPRTYVPQLLAMQLTEPVLIVSLIGGLTFLSAGLREKYRRLFILFLVWFLFPLTYILVHGMNLYDNTRQLLFLFPGLFLLTAIGIDFLFGLAKAAWIQVAVAALILFPGVLGIARSHPYEYAFYNFLTISRTQIFRKYETDYWATSFKDTAFYLNRNAPQDSQVIAWGPAHLIARYARPDLDVKSFDDLTDATYVSAPYYLVLTTRYDVDQTFFPEIPPVYVVKQHDSVYAVVKYITP